jgi:hypothetical protein
VSAGHSSDTIIIVCPSFVCPSFVCLIIVLFRLVWYIGIESRHNWFKKFQLGGIAMTIQNKELRTIIERFAVSGWDVIDATSQEWLDGNISDEELLPIIRQAEGECGSCGCEFDPLYKKAIELISN